MRLLIIDTAYLGDLLLATPLIRAAGRCSSRGKVDLLTSPAGYSAVRNNPGLDRVLVLAKQEADRGLGGFARAVRWIRAGHSDVALLPRRSVRSHLLARLAGVPRRIGFHRGPGRVLLTDAVSYDRSRHQVDRNLALLGPLGYQPQSGRRAALEAFPSPREKTEVEAWLSGRDIGAGRPFYAIGPGSVWATKRWPVARFAELAIRLAGRGRVVVVGGRAEQRMAREIIESCRRSHLGHRVHDATHFSPTACVYLLSHAKTLVANDSGALHMGDAAGIPLVGLYGPTAPSQGHAPRGDPRHMLVGVDGLACRPCGRHGSHRCPLGHWRCMTDLETAKVDEAVRRSTGEFANSRVG